MLFDGIGGINCDLVICGVAALDGEVIIQKLNIEIGIDEALDDHVPHDASHLIAIHIHDGIIYLDFSHNVLCKQVDS